ncbi:hypothetical protein D9613_012510 [Agrocybe pediades]|uniref:Amidohydrolase-related domain-containing protein n=1 Tax=Agrocybe pediades TaxID=84607 RepID=A0A8H4VN32_9AGAR|nr:hypothetical protein D9613_012510 [Agrocybe pediades]
MKGLPVVAQRHEQRVSTKPRRKLSKSILALVLLACAPYIFFVHTLSHDSKPVLSSLEEAYRASVIAKCDALRTPAGPPPSFKPASRLASNGGKGNERFVPGTEPVLLRNAKIWTGARNGTEVVFGDVLLDQGLVMSVGYIPPSVLAKYGGKDRMNVLDMQGKWVTPGLVDLHSHIGVESAPHLRGAADGNSRKAPILPWLRSVDGINTHDESYQLAMSGGVTTAQILPGSANNIGGQAFVIKLRPTSERSTISKVLEAPLTLTHNASDVGHVPWRHMKHACGENPDRLYSQTRMDAQWNFRHAYDEARKIRDKQDEFCSKVDQGDWAGLEGSDFPEDLQWESLVDVLRGKVRLAIHCYEAVDLDGIVRLSNEFKFPVASFHHAGETYLVPDLLKKTWGGTPSIALFATNFRKKREAYRGSEFAPRVLAEHGIPVVMKSDHPVLNSRYLLYEAQLAHYYGLNPALALASATSVPARAAGLSHRIGTLAEGYDADLVIWDSHPLSLGATPEQVYVDGIPQLSKPTVLKKPRTFQDLPSVPNWDKEKNETVKWEGLPPLKGWKKGGKVRLVGVKSVLGLNDLRSGDDDEAVFERGSLDFEEGRTVIVEDGKVTCIERVHGDCLRSIIVSSDDDETVIDLKGGAIAAGLTTYGSPLGLVEIRLEPSTNDGKVLDPLVDGDLPSLLTSGKEGGVVKAVDGLMFEGRNTLLAYRGGVTTAVTAPVGNGFLQGISAAFSVGAPHALERGAVVQEETALHITISHLLSASVSTQIAALRKLLLDGEGRWATVRKGKMHLVISVESADIMSTLIHLKKEVEDETGDELKMTFSGATEAHLLANQIANAGVSVILTSPRPFPGTWDQRRILAGPPLTKDTSITTLLDAGVNVAIGVVDEYAARNLRFDLAWIALDSNGTISQNQAFALATTNLHKALGLSARSRVVVPDLVLYSGGGALDFGSKVVGVASAARGVVEIF